MLTSSSKHSLTFTWEQPKLLNGPIKYYQAFLMRYEADYFVPSICEAITELPKTDTKGLCASSINPQTKPNLKCNLST